jgi:hypothetical protein
LALESHTPPSKFAQNGQFDDLRYRLSYQIQPLTATISANRISCSQSLTLTVSTAMVIAETATVTAGQCRKKSLQIIRQR